MQTKHRGEERPHSRKSADIAMEASWKKVDNFFQLTSCHAKSETPVPFEHWRQATLGLDSACNGGCLVTPGTAVMGSDTDVAEEESR